jgi:hypothetical protein
MLGICESTGHPTKPGRKIFFIPFLKCVTKAKRSETPKTLLQLKNTIEQRGSPKLTLKIDNGTIVPKEILILLDCGKYCTNPREILIVLDG